MATELDSKPVIDIRTFRPLRHTACSCSSPAVGEVIDSRPFTGHDLAMRRRVVTCEVCQGRFKTIEVVATQELLDWLKARPGYTDGDGI